MRDGAYPINNARSKLVDISRADQGKHLAGGRVGRVPFGTNGPRFDTGLRADALRALSNLISTPQIGGSTEAQQMIGKTFGAILHYLISPSAPSTSLKSTCGATLLLRM